MKAALLRLCGLALCLARAAAEEVCYEDVGCFTTDYPWTDSERPLPKLPESPAQVGTRFLLFTRDAGQKDVFYNNDDLGDFSPARKTIIMTHGFIGSTNSSYLVPSKDLILQKGNYNVVIVDWQDGASIPYLQATANTQLVGRQIALLVNKMISVGAVAADFHLVGHSLGSHVCGYAGNGIQGLGRITGLDPAEPYFEDTALAVHLDPSDAQYVDVIHTDGKSLFQLGLGFTKANGHVDFWPNNGKNQPGCSILSGIDWSLAEIDLAAAAGLLICSHARARTMFVESLRQQSCQFLAFQCDDYNEYLYGDCQRMVTSNLGVISLENIDMNLSGSYYLQTTDVDDALCVHYYELTVELNADQRSTIGNMDFVLNGEQSSSTDLLTGWTGYVYLTSNGVPRTTVHTPVSLGALRSIDLTYYDYNIFSRKSLSAAAVLVSTADQQLLVTTQRFCYSGPAIAHQATATFTPCL